MSAHSVKWPSVKTLLASGAIVILALSSGTGVNAQQAAQGAEQAAQEAPEGESNFCQELLAAHPEGGGELSVEVKALVLASPDVAKDIHSCACPGADVPPAVLANAAQSRAIGSGLALAVKKLKKSDATAVDDINKIIATSCSKSLKTAYLAGTSEEATAAIPGEAGVGTGVTIEPISAPVPVLPVIPGGGGGGGGTVSPN